MFNVFGNVAPMPPTLKSGKAKSELSSNPSSLVLLVLSLFFAGDGDFIMSMFKLALRAAAASWLLSLKRFIGDGFVASLTLPSSSSSSSIGDSSDALFCLFFCVVVDVNGNLRLPSIEGCGGERCCEGRFLLTTLPDLIHCCRCCEVGCFDGDFFAVVVAIF